MSWLRWPRRRDPSDDWFRTLVSTSPQPTLIHDSRTRLFCNAAYAELLGYPSIDATLRAPSFGKRHLFAPDLEMLQGIWRDILAGRQTWTRQRIRVRRLDDRVRWIDLMLGPVAWQGRPAIQTIQIDITREIEVAAELQLSEDRLRRLIENSVQAISIHDLERRLFVNQAYVRMMGHADADAALAQPILQHVPPQDADGVIREWIRTLTGEHAWSQRRARRLRADGRVVWVDMIRSPIVWAGTPAILASSIDVTAEVEAQHQLRRNEAEMRQAAKLEAVGRLAGGIAHDFNNLLATIAGFAGFLHEDLAPGSRHRDYAARIVKVSAHATDIVRQLLAFTRAGDVERAVLDLGALLEDSRPLLRASLPASTRLDIDVGTTPLLAKVNQSQIYQVLLNLCLNANDALEGRPGAIVVTLAAADGMVPAAGNSTGDVASAASGTLAADRPYARLTVSDDGTGMDQATLARIFDPFFTTKPPGRGTGLGLAVMHGTISAYGGVYAVRTRVHHGTTFDIYLPLADPAEPAPPPAPVATGLCGHETILVIDDEPDLATMMAIGLERLGYAVDTFLDPVEALAEFGRAPATWAAVVTDDLMPEMRGRALAGALHAIRPDCPIILCSGLDAGDGAAEPGVAAFLPKPVEPQRIAATLRRLLDIPRHQAQDDARPQARSSARKTPCEAAP